MGPSAGGHSRFDPAPAGPWLASLRPSLGALGACSPAARPRVPLTNVAWYPATGNGDQGSFHDLRRAGGASGRADHGYHRDWSAPVC
jgi:hypothetical protein